jgi:hypothetical protein
MAHTIGKLLMRAKNFLQTSSQSKVYTQSYGPPKLQESQLWEFHDSHLVPRQNDIWVLVPWPSIEYTIKGEGGGFPQVWALVSLVSSCLPVVHSCTKVLQLHINQFVVWFVQVHVND